MLSNQKNAHRQPYEVNGIFFSYRWEIKMEKGNRKWEKILVHISTTTFTGIPVENQT